MPFWRRKQADLDLENEITHHLHHLANDYVQQGHSPEEAMRLAKRDFGGGQQLKETCREERPWGWTTGLGQDISYGLRMMRRTPIVTAAAILSLALGIGANAAVVSLINIVLYQDLPVPAPSELSLIHWTGPGFNRDLADAAAGSMHREGATRVANFFPYRAYTELRKQVGGLASIAAYNFSQPVSTSYNGRPAVVHERPVSGNFFDTLQVKASLGRTVTDADDTFAAPAAVVVSHRFWQSWLGADTGAIGRSIVVNNKPRIIVGVLPQEFYGLLPGDSTDIYSPMHHAAFVEERKDRNPLGDDRFWGTALLLRSKAGATTAQLTPALNVVFRSTWTREPKDPASAPRVRLDPGSRGVGNLRREFRSPLLILGGLVSLLLLLACMNIANLLLARADARRREVATRVALGCGQARLLRQFFIESVLLALVGGAASLVVAYLTANFLGNFVVTFYSAPIAVSPDFTIFGIVAAITGLTLLLFGLFPAWRTSLLGKGGAGALRQHASSGGGTGYESRKAERAGRVLVLAQISISVVLVLSAVLFTRNLIGIQSSDPGFDRRNLILFSIRPGTSGYDKDRLAQLYRNLEQRLAETPGVQNVGLASMRPMNVGGWWENVRLVGQTDSPQASINGITPGYLPLYNTRMIAGRNLTQADIDTRSKVAVISEDLAIKLGRGASVLGQSLEYADGPPGKPRERFQIVGIAPLIAATSMKERPYAVWLPFGADSKEATIVLRTAASPQSILPGVRQTMTALDRDLPLVDVMTMEEQMAKGLQHERMFAALCSGFGGLALILSVIGLYGVIAYSVTRRTGEIGLRLAVGATPKDVLKMIARDGIALAIFGMLAAAPIVWLGAKYVEKELHQMKPLDPASIALSMSIMALAVLAAVVIPALRASSVAPAETLRHQ